ncbi:MerR family transcriptional regulator [Thiomicrorhabdus sp. 6S3-12]|uniref:MerR family transcriptional regulator n=1 Tax=Thiomicrorhabdus sp. 6S3-12 TaxID=2819681 RepID=UPI001AADA8B8|nr:MerR family transcriptional regulator [Thiomicrorhabdus sp. 6S3-12]MBO1923915.1 MerR family transcriptional regulator [Thiomicrorhabdus sp. 6S3-12]
MDQPLYPIREVSRLTGVNAITLRAWERRYGLVEPVRTESGHRLYTDEHIEVLKRAVDLTRQGVAISQVKAILQESPQASEAPNELRSIANTLAASAQSGDYAALQTALDSLFVEFDELSALQVLCELDVDLHDVSARICWESALLPRLYSRLYFAQQRLKSLKGHRHCQNVYVASSSKVDSQLAQVLCGLWLSHQGIVPFLGGIKPLPSTQALKQLQCCGLVMLAERSLAEFAEETGYPGLASVFVTLEEGRMEKTPAVQMELKSYRKLFAELPQIQAASF